MRRWLPIALLLALAGLVALALRWRSNRVEPVAAEPEAAHAAPAVAEHAVQSESDAQRAPLVPLNETAATAKPNPSAARLKVRVIGQSKREPIAGVRVILSPAAGEELVKGTRNIPGTQGDLENSPITGAEGLVRFELPPDRDLRVRARLEDATPATPAPARVDRGRVTAHWASRLDDDLRIRANGAQTNAEGTIVEIPPLLAGEARELVLLVGDELDGRVVGRVVCAETREPVAGARVRILTGGQVRTEWHTPGPDERTTGNDGQFELPFSLASDPRLCVEAAGYGLRYANLDAVHADLAHALVVYVSRAATLNARVLDAAGAPIEGAWVELSTKGYLLAAHEADEQGFFSSGISFSFPPDEHWRAQTGSDGQAKIEGLPARVEISAAVVQAGKQLRRESAGLEFQPGEDRQVEWRIGSGTVVHGLALDQDGKPVSGLQIWAAISGSLGRRYFMNFEESRLGARTSTDRDGRFTLQDLAPGRWSIGPGAVDSSSIAPIAELVEIAGEPMLELTLHVSRGLYIRGRVLAPSGEGAPNAWVNGYIPPADRPEGMRTESDGSFALGPVGPGTITLMADAIGRFASSDPVQASAGDSGVVLQLKQGGMIRGRVVDGVTGVACTAQLVFVPDQFLMGIFASGMQTSTNPDGTFGRAGLAPDRWSVTASTADGKFAQHAHIEVGAGSDSGELVFSLSPGGKLRLGYKGAQPWVFVTVTRDGAAVLMQTGVEPGKFTEYMAPAGSLVLEIRKNWTGPARTKALELKPGETKEITLTDED